MKIKEIVKTKKLVKVKLDNGAVINVFDAVYINHNLYINKDISDKEIDEITKENKIEELFSLSIKRLIISDYSPTKIEEFLKKKGANKTEIKKTLDKLRQFDFLNEEKLLNEIIEHCDYKHYGYEKIIFMLQSRKISEEKIHKVKYNLNREIKEARILSVILLRKYNSKNASQAKKAVYLGLIRAGYEESLANEITSQIITYNHIHEINVLKLDYDKYFLKFSKKYIGNELNHKIISSLLSKGYKISDINEVKELRK